MGEEPKSDHDYTIHALNIHGTFFERACQTVISDTRPWDVVSTNYPVEFRGQPSALDILAQASAHHAILTLPIECKKNNPDFIQWVFFRQYPATCGRPRVLGIKNTDTGNAEKPWSIGLSVTEELVLPYPVTTEGRETRGTYAATKKGDRSKTSNDAIQAASRQIAIAALCIFHDERTRTERLSRSPSNTGKPWRKQVFLPLIVTTATLSTCNFDPADVSIKTGEIPWDKVELLEHPALVYEYPVPRQLQYPLDEWVTNLTEEEVKGLSRLNILVINSAHLAGVLQQIANEVGHWI